MNLIILTEADRTGDEQFTLTDHRARHIREVLHASANETVEVGLLNGSAGTARITLLTPERVILEIANWREMPKLRYEVDLICAVPRPKTLKKVLTVAAMMGVRAVHFVRANRTDKSYLGSPFLQKPDCLPYLFDGLSQGKFTRLPEISVHPLFRPFVEDQVPVLYPAEHPVVRLLCDGSTDQVLSKTVSSTSAKQFVVAIGPEGGWVPFEADLLKNLGFLSCTLGPWILRVEFAVTAALAQLELAYRNSCQRTFLC